MSNCTHCGEPIDRDADDAPLTFQGEPIHWDCLEDACKAADDPEFEAEWEIEQRGLDGEPAKGQTTMDGGVAKDGGDR